MLIRSVGYNFIPSDSKNSSFRTSFGDVCRSRAHDVKSFMFNAGLRSWRVGPTAQQFHSGPCGSLYLWNLENVERKKNTSLEYHTQQDYPFKLKDTQHRALTTLQSRQQKWRTNKDFLRLSQTSKNGINDQ